MNGLKQYPRLNVPGVLRGDKPATEIEDNYKKINAGIEKLKIQLRNILVDPAKNDRVYQVLQSLFLKKQEIDLYRNHKKRDEIQEFAQKRFILGYPPRKNSDTSMGDAINWEWLIYVANLNDADVWIVSRDGDYGKPQDGEGFLIPNDWLAHEFRERTNNKRKIVLCPKLSVALHKFGVSVTPEEEKEEQRIIEEAARSSSLTGRITIGDVVTATIIRTCAECGRRFEVQENEKSCPSCANI